MPANLKRKRVQARFLAVRVPGGGCLARTTRRTTAVLRRVQLSQVIKKRHLVLPFPSRIPTIQWTRLVRSALDQQNPPWEAGVNQLLPTDLPLVHPSKQHGFYLPVRRIN